MWGLPFVGFVTLLAAPVKLTELLSTCVDACSRGCDEIRSVQIKREESGSLARVEFKDPNDAKSALTEADGAAQRAIVNALRSEWGHELRIVGEEDDDDQESNNDAGDMRDDNPLRRNLVVLDSCLTAKLSDITIYVDPLDGTREFVENRLQNCQSLVGIAVKNKSVAGAVGVPFPEGDLRIPSSIVYGLVGAGVGTSGEKLKAVDTTEVRPLLATGDSPMKVMVAARDVVSEKFGGKNMLYGGAGNKILATARGEVDCTIQHKFGGPWDTCAPEAVLTAMGGKITDLFGKPISVYNDPKQNAFGFLATSKDAAISHEDLSAALLANEAIQEYRQQVSDTIDAPSSLN